MQDHAKLNRAYHDAERNGTLDQRDPVAIAGGQAKYVELEMKNDKEYDSNINRSSSLRLAADGLKKRFSGMRGKKHDD